MPEKEVKRIEIRELTDLAVELHQFNEFLRWFKRFLAYASTGGFITTAVYMTAKIMRLF